MRVTADTNVVISGMFWRGNPRRVLDAARDRIIDLYTTAALLKELEEVLGRERFANRLAAANTTVRELVEGYAALANIVDPASVPAVVIRDPDGAAHSGSACRSPSGRRSFRRRPRRVSPYAITFVPFSDKKPAGPVYLRKSCAFPRINQIHAIGPA